MQRRLYRRIATSALSVLAAVAVGAPYSAFACGSSASHESCCCKQPESTTTDEASVAGDAEAPGCLTKDCGCCRPAVPQNVPSEPTTIQLTAAAIPAHVPLFHGGTEFSTRVAGKERASLAAIPHRILHCSWLI
jgi:hypothetical protein